MLPAVAPVAVVEAEKKNPWELIRFYGRLRASVIGTTGGPESFTKPTMVAITAAGNHVFANPDVPDATTFQVAQTRVGFKVNEGGQAGGTVEIDFADFGKSTAAVSSKPRLRAAAIDWKPKDGHKLTFGQTWDLYGALQTYHSNWVSNHYYNGQSAFMRHQAMYLYNPEKFEVGVALGLPGLHNNSPAMGNLEGTLLPTLAGRFAWKFGEKSRVGASAIVGNLKYSKDQRRTSASGLAFFDLNIKKFNFRAEGYFGQNLGNLGALTLSYGSVDADMSEVGGWAAVKYAGERHGVNLTAGMATVLDPDDVAAGYVRDADTNVATRTGVGIENSMQVRGGYQFKPTPGFSLFVEPFAYVTTHKLLDVDTAELDAQRTMWGVEAGAVYIF